MKPKNNLPAGYNLYNAWKRRLSNYIKKFIEYDRCIRNAQKDFQIDDG